MIPPLDRRRVCQSCSYLVRQLPRCQSLNYSGESQEVVERYFTSQSVSHSVQSYGQSVGKTDRQAGRVVFQDSVSL